MLAIRGLTIFYISDILQIMDIKVHIPIEVKRLNRLAEACKNAQSDDFKALWYKKMIDLAHKYKLMDYVMRKLVH